jgi:hypothetical protein
MYARRCCGTVGKNFGDTQTASWWSSCSPSRGRKPGSFGKHGGAATEAHHRQEADTQDCLVHKTSEEPLKSSCYFIALVSEVLGKMQDVDSNAVQANLNARTMEVNHFLEFEQSGDLIRRLRRFKRINRNPERPVIEISLRLLSEIHNPNVASNAPV